VPGCYGKWEWLIEGSKMIKLSERTRKLIEVLYKIDTERSYVSTVLEAECADNLPFSEIITLEGLERVRFSVLKLTTENGKFDEWVKLAYQDWRDLFVAAGFGEDVQAHSKWADSVLKGN
jgi:hypothetical protein